MLVAESEVIWTTLVRLEAGDDLPMVASDVIRRGDRKDPFYTVHIGGEEDYLSMYLGDPTLVDEIDRCNLWDNTWGYPLSLIAFLTMWQRWAENESVFVLQFKQKEGRLHPYFVIKRLICPPDEKIYLFSVWNNTRLLPNAPLWSYDIGDVQISLSDPQEEMECKSRQTKAQPEMCLA